MADFVTLPHITPKEKPRLYRKASGPKRIVAPRPRDTRRSRLTKKH